MIFLFWSFGPHIRNDGELAMIESYGIQYDTDIEIGKTQIYWNKAVTERFSFYNMFR